MDQLLLICPEPILIYRESEDQDPCEVQKPIPPIIPFSQSRHSVIYPLTPGRETDAGIIDKAI
jgi:hypothetical protein